MDSGHYDVLARPSRDASAAEPTTISYSEAALERLHQRVRALLADRFKLVVHKETREMPIYVLIVAKNGPYLEPSKNPGPRPVDRGVNSGSKGHSMKMSRRGSSHGASAAPWWTGRGSTELSTYG
ncbi:hypothetical protein SBA3_1820003 [Candidatus Sulfopaludibacter sp. SbA3]|nr:hypothetical protein SBA3_1820003 [Candidatus Sulfopaludibacter sp. SbA3]